MIQHGENVCMGQMQIGLLFARFNLMSSGGELLFQVSTDKFTSTGEVLYQSKKYPHLASNVKY